MADDEIASYCLAAFAIEDRVDFRLVEHVRTEPSAEMEDPFVEFSEPIVPGERAQSDYFGQVHAHMRSALGLLARWASSYERWRSESIFDRIDSIAISTAGVVERGRELIQLPLFNWITEEHVTWVRDRRTIRGFDFVLVICDIVRDLLDRNLVPPTDVDALARKIFVVNDVTACAAAEYNHRSRNGSFSRPHDFVFVKAHNGINVGVIEENFAFMKTGHTEMGHIYPIPHVEDARNEFRGTCYFHGDCLEGMISLASIVERARPSRRDWQPIPEWNDMLKQLEANAGGKRLRESALFKKVVGDGDQPGTTLGLDISSHYIAQLVHALMLSPLLPDQIVIGGRFATSEVIECVGEKIWDMARGYPARRLLASREELREYIQQSRVEDPHNTEIIGALEIARGRTRLAREQPEKLLRQPGGRVYAVDPVRRRGFDVT